MSAAPQNIDDANDADADGASTMRHEPTSTSATECAERALALYRSCHARVLKLAMSSFSSTSPGSVILDGDGIHALRGSPCLLRGTRCVDGGNGNGTTTAAATFTINLELRMAQTLRLLAAMHASTGGGASRVNGDCIAHDGNNLVDAIKYHDRAVSLLVGVSEDEEELEGAVKEEVSVMAGRDRSSSITVEETPMATLHWETPNGNDFASCTAGVDNDDVVIDNGRYDGGILLTINVSVDDSLPLMTMNTQQQQQQKQKTFPTLASFLRPTENQRVLAISASLNALANLYAMNGNDSAAMSAYREALEILQAANAEEEEEEEEKYTEKRLMGMVEKEAETERRIGLSYIAADLADTLTNVGNFHLRRDELDAAYNAYSTVWGLYNKDEEIRVNDESNKDVFVGCAAAAATARKESSLSYYPEGALVAMNNLGVVHERRSEFHKALSCYETVYCIRLRQQRKHDGTCDNEHIHVDVINPLLNIGNVHHRLKQYNEACSTYSEVVRMCKHATRTMTKNKEEDMILRILQTLAGTLRNWGTCYLEQQRFTDAIDKVSEASKTEENIICILLPVSTFMFEIGGHPDRIAAVKRAKESKAQLAGLLGCLYLECKDDGLVSLNKSAESFRETICLYQQMGHDESYSKIIWARHNLDIVDNLRAEAVAADLWEAPAPPPPPTSSSLSFSLPSNEAPVLQSSAMLHATTHDTNGDNDIDSTLELDEVLKSDGKYAGYVASDESDSTFKGLFVSSTDELDDFLTRTGARPTTVTGGDGERSIATKESFKVDFDTSYLDEVEVEPFSVLTTKQDPLSLTHRAVSATPSNFIPPLRSSSASPTPSQCHVIMGTDTMENSVEAAGDFVVLAEDLWKKGDIPGATENYTIAHSIYITHLGDDESSKEVAMVLKKLADLNREDGALDAAMELYTEALEMELAAHGQHLPQTLNAAGVLCLQQDDFRSAMDFHRRALQIQKKSQGSGGVGDAGGQSKYETYETLVNIGNVYYSERNNFSNIRSNGVDYKEFIESGFLSWIALAHDMRGEYVKSIQFYEESIQTSMTRKSKESKRETSLTLNRLGSLTRELGRYDEAMDYHQKALNIQKSGNGVAKAMTAETCVLIGMVKSKLSEFKSALDLHEDSLIVLKKTLGEDHLSVSKTMAQIGSVHYELSNWEKAMEYLAEAEKIQLETVGEMNRDTLETQALIGRVLSATGSFEEALLKFSNVYERQNILFNSKHPTIADTLSYIGDCFLVQGMATEARGKFVHCYNMRKHFFTVDQIHIAESMVDIIRARSGQPGRALEIYQNAQEVYEEYLPDNHVHIGRLRVYEGDSYAELLNFTMAIERYEQAKQIFYTTFGGEFNIDYATVMVSIGRALLRKCDYDSAKKTFTSALGIYQQILPEGHLKLESTLNDLGRVKQEEALCV